MSQGCASVLIDFYKLLDKAIHFVKFIKADRVIEAHVDAVLLKERVFFIRYHLEWLLLQTLLVSGLDVVELMRCHILLEQLEVLVIIFFEGEALKVS